MTFSVVPSQPFSPGPAASATAAPALPLLSLPLKLTTTTMTTPRPSRWASNSSSRASSRRGPSLLSVAVSLSDALRSSPLRSADAQPVHKMCSRMLAKRSTSSSRWMRTHVSISSIAKAFQPFLGDLIVISDMYCSRVGGRPRDCACGFDGCSAPCSRSSRSNHSFISATLLSRSRTCARAPDFPFCSLSVVFPTEPELASRDLTLTVFTLLKNRKGVRSQRYPIAWCRGTTISRDCKLASCNSTAKINRGAPGNQFLPHIKRRFLSKVFFLSKPPAPLGLHKSPTFSMLITLAHYPAKRRQRGSSPFQSMMLFVTSQISSMCSTHNWRVSLG